MNGAESLLRALKSSGVDVCFANPGTSEMHFVAAMDRVEGVRCVLGLFEGVATGAADGYGRMLGRPAATLLHLGPGLANGLSNLHNAVRASSPIVNIIGDHAVSHRALDAPLTSDIEGTARPFSHWVRTSPDANSLGPDTVAAVAAARSAPGRVACLIAPADATWTEVSDLAPAPALEPLVAPPQRPDDRVIEAAARILSNPRGKVALVLGGHATREPALNFAGRIAAKLGVDLLAETFAPMLVRGAGRVPVQRIPYVVDQAIAALAQYSALILVSAKAPVAFFGYPGKPGRLHAPGTLIHELCGTAGDVAYALEALAERVAALGTPPAVAQLELPVMPEGPITPGKIAALLGALLPEQAIVVDESITTGKDFLEATRGARPHDWILPTGGSIGYALPVGAGAAIACPSRKVVVLESDGSGLYMPQALWTYARESLDVLVLVFANRKYQILGFEMANMGVTQIGPKARDLLEIGRPDVDWVAMARSFGVEGARASSMEELSRSVRAGLDHRGPYLVEVCL